MCGIVAACGHIASDDGLRMLRRLAHRGPDGEGHVALPHAWLGHTRLSIVDVEGGDQPLVDRAASTSLVANGELYNHTALRAEFAGRLTTRSDSEVALHLFDRDGARGLARLRGMFALAAATDDGRFVAARDPVGIKPLYWARRGDVTLFASELKAFDPDWRPHVRVFPPGCSWTPQDGLQRLVDLPTEPGTGVTALLAGAQDGPSPEILDELRDRLVAAVERRLMADVPVGVFLSGGLDSSLVAAIAARAAGRDGKRLASFAVGSPGSPDLVAARQVADLLGTDHHERVYTADELVATLPSVVSAIESFDPRLVHSAVPNYLLAELAARHVKVVLTGEGADELFAGYEHHRHLGAGLQDALVREVEGLHNLNLQRCDRVTMAHGLEARVPFLDLDVIELALALPVRWRAPSGRMEKWLLRRAFHGWLPDTLLMRRKAQFGDGSGASTVLRRVAAAEVGEAELRRLRHVTDPPLRTREEAYYWRLFAENLDGIDAGDAVGRSAVA